MFGTTCLSFISSVSQSPGAAIDEKPAARLASRTALVAGQISRACGCLAPGDYAIETEKYEPSLSLAFKLAHLFGQPIEAIFELGDQELRKVKLA
jgi:hypothetical protein